MRAEDPGRAGVQFGTELAGQFSLAQPQVVSETVRFLARVAVVKHRFLRAALVFTTVMALSAGLFLILRPVML